MRLVLFISFTILFSSKVQSSIFQSFKGCHVHAKKNVNIDEIANTTLDKIKNSFNTEVEDINYPNKLISYIYEICDSGVDRDKLVLKARKKLKEAVGKRLKKKFRKIKFSSKIRPVEDEYLKLLQLQTEYANLIGIKPVIKNSEKLRKKFATESRKYIGERRRSCSNIDLKNELTSKVYDQYDRGWCYAFSGADLISQHTGKDVSRVHLAVAYNKHDIFNIIQSGFTPSTGIPEGGYVFSALNVAKKVGLCLEEDLPSAYADIGSATDKGGKSLAAENLSSKVLDDNKKLKASMAIIAHGFKQGASRNEYRRANKEFEKIFSIENSIIDRSDGFFTGIHFVETLHGNYNIINSNHLKLQFLDQLKKLTPIKKLKEKIEKAVDNLFLNKVTFKSTIEKHYRENYFTCVEGELLATGALGQMFPNLNFNSFVQSLESTSKKNFFLDLQNKSCDDSKINLDYKINTKLALFSSAEKHIDEALSRGKLASIEYSARIFDSIVNVPTVASHVSTIVARRWNEQEKTCEYQIKNSWGATWRPTETYSKMTSNGDGFVWVPEDEIKTATATVTHITE